MRDSALEKHHKAKISEIRISEMKAIPYALFVIKRLRFD